MFCVFFAVKFKTVAATKNPAIFRRAVVMLVLRWSHVELTCAANRACGYTTLIFRFAGSYVVFLPVSYEMTAINTATACW